MTVISIDVHIHVYIDIDRWMYFTCVLRRKARATTNIWLPTPSFGPYNSTRYVIPNNGIRTNNAFDALRY